MIRRIREGTHGGIRTRALDLAYVATVSASSVRLAHGAAAGQASPTIS
jgi:hypothetical protein